MAGITNHDSPFAGRTRSLRESEKVRAIGGARLTVEKYRCTYGVGREVGREMAA